MPLLCLFNQRGSCRTERPSHLPQVHTHSAEDGAGIPRREPLLSASPPSCLKLQSGRPASALTFVQTRKRKASDHEHSGKLGSLTGQAFLRTALPSERASPCWDDSHRDLPVRHRRLQPSTCRTRCSIQTGRGAQPAGGPAQLLEGGKRTQEPGEENAGRRLSDTPRSASPQQGARASLTVKEKHAEQHNLIPTSQTGGGKRLAHAQSW